MLPLPDLTAETLALVAQIPTGRVATFGDVARALGDVRASMAVAAILNSHRGVAPGWHRVIPTGGRFHSPCAERERLLLQEGIAVRDCRVVLDDLPWNDFRGPAPLLDLQRLQAVWLEQAQKAADFVPPADRHLTVAGIDVSFRPPDGAVAAYVPFDGETGERLSVTLASCRITFPYISTYLTFRELPALLAVIAAARQNGPLADVLLVDGSGRLHPRGGGLATHLGAVLEHPTVGVTKKLLAGKALETTHRNERGILWRPLELAGGIQGAMIETPTKSRKALYVSPGYGIDVSTATQLALKWLRPNRRLVEPIYWADRLSREAARM